MKIVIDANVYASSLMKPEGIIGKMLSTFFQDNSRYIIITSPAIFLELERILQYPKVYSRIAFTKPEIDSWLSNINFLQQQAL